MGSMRKPTFINKFLMRRRAQKLNKYAKEIGRAETDYIEAMKRIQYDDKQVNRELSKKFLLLKNKGIVNKVLNS